MSYDYATADYIGLSEADWAELRRHTDFYPDHGDNCDCMDMFVFKMQRWIERQYGPVSENPRFQLVLRRAVKERGKTAQAASSAVTTLAPGRSGAHHDQPLDSARRM